MFRERVHRLTGYTLLRIPRAAPADVLSERELEVLSLIATGAGNKGIAEDLSISESTVKTHVANIFQKLDVSGRTDAVTKAIREGIIKV